MVWASSTTSASITGWMTPSFLSTSSICSTVTLCSMTPAGLPLIRSDLS